MTILVAYASAHGSTRSIAERIGAALAERGERVEIRAMSGVSDTGSYQAFVLGSAVHSRAWLSEATGFLERERDALAGRPVWLFSVGMPAALRGPWRGFGAKEEALLADGLHRTLGAREHRLFSGVFRREHIPLAGRLVCGLLGVRYGDYRDWPEIDAWAAEIADGLESRGSVPAAAPAAEFVGAPDDERERGDDRQDVPGQGGGAEQVLQRRQVDQGGGEQQLEGDAGQQ